FAGDYLLNLLRQQQDMPGWAFARILPYEVAFILEPQANTIDSTFYVNAQRFGPQIAAYIQQANLASRIRFVQWTAHEFTAHDRGVLVLKGSMPIDTQARDIANAAFTAGLPDTPLT